MKVLRGIHYKTGQIIECNIRNKQIHYINDKKNENKDNSIIAPGLIDLQINGYKGFDFNEGKLSSEEWHQVTQELFAVGVTTYFPTVITNSFERLSKILETHVNNIPNEFLENGIVGGFHLEGPYISPEDGPRGAHERKFVRPPDWEEFLKLQEKAQGSIKIVTISAEWPSSISFIKKAVNSGVIVALGHTAANTKQIREAVSAGATMSTHLGNGAHISLPRHPNYIWDQLAEEDLWTTIIADGHHLPENVIKVINKVKNERMILVSDSVKLAGMEPGNYSTTVGGEVTLTEEYRLYLKGDSRLLAGSAQNLLQGIQNLNRLKICDLSEAWNKASIYPAKVMNLPQAKGLTEGAPADVVIYDYQNEDIVISKVLKQGKLVYKRGEN